MRGWNRLVVPTGRPLASSFGSVSSMAGDSEKTADEFPSPPCPDGRMPKGERAGIKVAKPPVFSSERGVQGRVGTGIAHPWAARPMSEAHVGLSREVWILWAADGSSGRRAPATSTAKGNGMAGATVGAAAGEAGATVDAIAGEARANRGRRCREGGRECGLARCYGCTCPAKFGRNGCISQLLLSSRLSTSLPFSTPLSFSHLFSSASPGRGPWLTFGPIAGHAGLKPRCHDIRTRATISPLSSRFSQSCSPIEPIPATPAPPTRRIPRRVAVPPTPAASPPMCTRAASS